MVRFNWSGKWIAPQLSVCQGERLGPGGSWGVAALATYSAVRRKAPDRDAKFRGWRQTRAATGGCGGASWLAQRAVAHRAPLPASRHPSDGIVRVLRRARVDEPQRDRREPGKAEHRGRRAGHSAEQPLTAVQPG